mgnify:CR=1 FL=1
MFWRTFRPMKPKPKTTQQRKVWARFRKTGSLKQQKAWARFLKTGSFAKNGKCVARLSHTSKAAKQHKWIPYVEYLKTSWWRSKRRQKMELTHWTCERCGKRATQVHHKHYRTLWQEKNADLVSICQACHEHEHEEAIQARRHIRAIQGDALGVS